MVYIRSDYNDRQSAKICTKWPVNSGNIWLCNSMIQEIKKLHRRWWRHEDSECKEESVTDDSSIVIFSRFFTNGVTLYIVK